MKVGILGAGNVAGKMAATLRAMQGVEAWGIASRDYDRAKDFAQANGIGRAFGSYGDLVAESAPDLVYIATPHSHHYEHMKLCLEQGKPVLCEKAFTLNASQAREILALGRQKKLLVAEAIWTRYLPIRTMMDETLAGGLIGKPVFLTANFCAPVNPGQERLFKPELAGGALLDLGVYIINFALMCFGGPVERIDSTWLPHEAGVDGLSTSILTYRDGKTAVLTCSNLSRADQRGLVSGEEGHIVFNHIVNGTGIEVYDRGGKLIAVREPPPQITGFEYEAASCRRALETGALECAEMPHAEILRVMEIMDAIRALWGFKYPMER